MAALCAALFVQSYLLVVGQSEHEDNAEQKADWNVGATLLGSMVFMMLVHHATNSHDPDIRLYSNEMINATIGIFCAVLAFSTINHTIMEINKRIFGGMGEEEQETYAPCIVIKIVVVVVCYATLQLVLYWCSNLCMSKKRYDQGVASNSNFQFDTKLRLYTSGKFCAHVTAFAAIAMFGSLQQVEFFRLTPFHSLITVLLAAVLLWLCGFVLRCFRDGVIYSDLEVEFREKAWEENCAEAENDVNCLALSFLFVQSLRFFITGHIPTAEGTERPGEGTERPVDLFHHTIKQILTLCAVTLLLGCTASVLHFVSKWLGMLEEEEEETEVIVKFNPGATGLEITDNGLVARVEKGSHAHAKKIKVGMKIKRVDGENYTMQCLSEKIIGIASYTVALTKERRGHASHVDERHASQPMLRTVSGRIRARKTKILSRGFEVAITWCQMAAAWCFFYVVQWVLGRMHHNGSGFRHISCGFAISHALLLTVLCFVWIFVLDKVDHVIGKRLHVNESIKRIIKTCGLLVGFSWEKAFDQAIESVAQHVHASSVHALAHHVAWVKAALVLVSLLVVVPAWHKFIAPMALDGWRFGFVPHQVIEKAKELTNKKSNEHRAEEFANQYRDILHRFQTIHHEEDLDMDTTLRVFEAGLHQACHP